MARMRLTILSPAMRPPMGNAPPVPDPVPFYVGEAMERPTPPPTLGAAQIIGGTLVGNKFMGCTYIAGPYSIPGFGEIEIEGVATGAPTMTRPRR